MTKERVIWKALAKAFRGKAGICRLYVFDAIVLQNWEVMNTAVLTGHQVSQAMKVFIVSQAGKVADVTLQSACHSEDESVLKVRQYFHLNLI